MDAVALDHVTSERPSEDDVCSGLRRIDPLGPEVVVTLPECVLARILPVYRDAREAAGASRTVRRAATRRWTHTVETVIREVRSGALAW